VSVLLTGSQGEEEITLEALGSRGRRACKAPRTRCGRLVTITVCARRCLRFSI